MEGCGIKVISNISFYHIPVLRRLFDYTLRSFAWFVLANVVVHTPDGNSEIRRDYAVAGAGLRELRNQQNSSRPT